MGGTPAIWLLGGPRGARTAVLFTFEVKNRGGLGLIVNAGGTLRACAAVIIVMFVLGL